MDNQQNCCRLGSSLASSNLGEFFSLGFENGYTITNSTLTGNGSESLNPMQTINWNYDELKKDFRHILCNEKGDIIIVWSKFDLAVIEKNRNGEYAKPVVLATDNVLPIAKVSFHPLNDYSLVVLFEMELLCVFDLRTREKQQYSLPVDISFTSFCFGPDIEWLRFTVFLTSTNSQIFAVCPVIPCGTILPAPIVDELFDWVAKQQASIHGESSLSFERMKYLQAYLHYTHDYLLRFLHLYDGPNCAEANSYYIFEHETERHKSFELNWFGPLNVLPAETVSIDTEICDIMAYTSKHNNVKDLVSPILITVDSKGAISFLLLDAQEDVRFSLSFPAWKEFENFTFPLPDLLLGEKLYTNKEYESNQNYMLQTGVVRGCIFCACPSTGKIIHAESGWMNSVLRSNQNYHNDIIEDSFGLGDLDETQKNEAILVDEVPKSHSWIIFESSDPISGCIVSLHPLMGNILVFNHSNEVCALNLSIHLRFHGLYSNYIHPFPFVAGKNTLLCNQNFLGELEGKIDSVYFQKKEDQVLLEIADGFAGLPPFSRLVSGDHSANTIHNDQKALFDTAALIESKIVTPLFNFSELLRFHQEFLFDSFLNQQKVVCGNEGSQLESNSILKIIEVLRKNDEQLTSRLEKLIQKYQSVRELLFRYLSFAFNCSKRQITNSELFYKEKLTQWQENIADANRIMSSLKANIQLPRSSTLKPIDINPRRKDLNEKEANYPQVISTSHVGLNARSMNWKRLQDNEKEAPEIDSSLMKRTSSSMENCIVLSSDDSFICQEAIKNNEEILLQAKIRLGILSKRIQSLKLGLVNNN